MTTSRKATSLDLARDYLETAAIARMTLTELYDTAEACHDQVNPKRVAELHDSIRFALKSAEVLAHIAVAEAIGR